MHNQLPTVIKWLLLEFVLFCFVFNFWGNGRCCSQRKGIAANNLLGAHLRDMSLSIARRNCRPNSGQFSVGNKNFQIGVNIDRYSR